MKFLTLFLFFSTTTIPLFTMTTDSSADAKDTKDAKVEDVALSGADTKAEEISSIHENYFRELLAKAKEAERLISKKKDFQQLFYQNLLACFKYAQDNKLDVEKTAQTLANIIKELKFDLEQQVDSKTILHISALCGKANVVRALCLAGAEIDCLTNSVYQKETALHLAAKKGDNDTVKVLLDFKAHVGALDSDESTPLHRAASCGNKDVCITLINAGADCNAKNCFRSSSLNPYSGTPKDHATLQTRECFL